MSRDFGHLLFLHFTNVFRWFPAVYAASLSHRLTHRVSLLSEINGDSVIFRRKIAAFHENLEYYSASSFFLHHMLVFAVIFGHALLFHESRDDRGQNPITLTRSRMKSFHVPVTYSLLFCYLLSISLFSRQRCRRRSFPFKFKCNTLNVGRDIDRFLSSMPSVLQYYIDTLYVLFSRENEEIPCT